MVSFADPCKPALEVNWCKGFKGRGHTLGELLVEVELVETIENVVNKRRHTLGELLVEVELESTIKRLPVW